MECPYCKEDIQELAVKCKHCGSMLNTLHNQPSSQEKSKIGVGLLALLLGGLGIHKFYLGSWGWGIVYIVFVFTYIPSIVALVEAIRYFTLDEDDFQQKARNLKGPFSFLW